MKTTTEVVDPRFVLVATRPEHQREDFAADVREGLASVPKRLPCRWFYDDAGSRLFEEICELPEYYLTRAEAEILTAHADAIAARAPVDVTLVELGSGSAAKTRLLIQALLARRQRLQYVPIDIASAALVESARGLLAEWEALDILAVAGEYHDGLDVVRRRVRGPRLILWLGSNIGNLDRAAAVDFLRHVRELLAPGDRMLCGVDLRKDRTVLERAYDDARGVTARFNLNLLTRINRELGGRFDVGAFTHQAVYDEADGRVSMYLVSERAQRVPIEALELEVAFHAGETIHTEDSYKYSLDEIDGVAARAGLSVDARWLDRDRRFAANVFSFGAQ